MVLKIGGWVFLQKRKIPRPEILSMMDSHRSHHFTVTPTYSHKNQLTHTHTCTGSSHIDTHVRKYIFTFTHAWAYRQTNSLVLLSFCSHFLIASVWISACRPPGPQSTESKLLGVKSDTRTSVCWGRQTGKHALDCSLAPSRPFPQDWLAGHWKHRKQDTQRPEQARNQVTGKVKARARLPGQEQPTNIAIPRGKVRGTQRNAGVGLAKYFKGTTCMYRLADKQQLNE